jgi:hypothetical protein
MTIKEKKTKQVERDIPILALEKSIKIQEKKKKTRAKSGALC